MRRASGKWFELLKSIAFKSQVYCKRGVSFPLITLMAFAGFEGAAAQATSGKIIIGHSQKCVDLPGGDLRDNITINQFQCDGSQEQVFTVVVGANNYYNITSGLSGKCLNVWNGSTEDNAPITQSQCDHSTQQGFSLAAVGSDYYNVVAGHSGKCLNVANGTMDDNIGLTQFQCNGSQAQMFWFQDLVGMTVAQRPQAQQQQHAAQQPQQTQQKSAQAQKTQQEYAQELQAQKEFSEAQQVQQDYAQQRIRELEKQLKDEKNDTRPRLTWEEKMLATPGVYIPEAQIPPVAALHIEYVIANQVSTGTDMATSVLFAGLDMVAKQVAGTAAGFGGKLTVSGMKLAGVSFEDLLGTDIVAGDDDLLIMLNNIGQWPTAWHGAHSVSISSGQKLPIHISWNLPTNRQHHIEIMERDSASDNDQLGIIVFPAGSLRPGYSEEHVLPNSSEGSVYTVKISVTDRLADEPNGYIPASMWHNNKAYCFPVYGCN